MSSSTLGPPTGVRGYRMLSLLEPPRPKRVATSTRAGWLIVATVCVGAFMGQLDASIVTVALPRLSTDLHVGVGAVEWVSLSYLLTLVALVAPIGAWADAIGRKSLYLAGFAVFGAASAACAVAPDIAVLCLARVVQAVGAALLQANSVAIIATNVPRARLGRAVGAQAAAQAIGLAAGPAIGGLLLTAGSWRLLFLVNVPAAVFGLIAGALLLPRSRDLAPARRLDRDGLSLFVGTTCLALLAFSLGAGSLGSRALAGPVAVAAMVCCGALIRQQRRSSEPLFDAGLVGCSAIRRSLLAGLAGYAAVFGVLVVAAFDLTSGGLSIARTGLVLAALPAGIGIAAPITGRLADRGHRALAATGLMVAAVALVAAAVLRPAGPGLAALLVVVGAGFGGFIPANNRTVMARADSQVAGAAAGLLNLTRGIGTAAGTAIAALVLAGGMRFGMLVFAALCLFAALGSGRQRVEPLDRDQLEALASS